MSKPTLIKILIALLFALAAALGLLRYAKDPYSPKTLSYAGVSDGNFEDYINRANNIVSKAPIQSTATFLAVGDIMLSRKVAKAMEENENWLLPYSNFEDTLSKVDFAFGNLESPFNGTEYYNPAETLVFNAPLKAIEGLKLNNFQVLNLANNHAFDQGQKGLRYTENLLDEFNIQHIGTGSTTKEAFKPAVVEQNGIKICFIGTSYASINDSGKTKNDFVARIEDLENLKSAITNLKSQCDFTVASMHAGTEYTYKPNKTQIAFAHAAIDYGADMVIGHHPHWIQTIERYCPKGQGTLPLSPPGGDVTSNVTERVTNKANEPDEGANYCSNPKYIFYSLGNFIFDQMWSKETTEGLALKINLSKIGCHPGNPNAAEGYPGSSSYNLDAGSGAGMTQGACASDLQGPRTPAALDQIELIPVIIENFSTPRPATPEETKKILQKIGETTALLK
jgi:poly-gamma-glutamate synthesis protein (capsule biosynthesis protein)